MGTNVVQDNSKSLEELIASHPPEAIRARLAKSPSQEYLRDFIFNGMEGTVTTIAIVSGFAGAQLSCGGVGVLCFAHLIGDGFSMEVGNYQATRADTPLRSRARGTEKKQIDLYPEHKREEIGQILSKMGIEGDELEQAIRVMTSDEKRWIDTMLPKEWGMSLTGPTPLSAAIARFPAYIMVGLFPLMAFVLQLAAPEVITHSYIISIVMTAIAFIGVGAAKSRFVQTSWSGLETLVVGSTAAGLSYRMGMLLRGLI